MRTHSIAVLAFDQISPFHLAVPCAVFGESHPGAPFFELRVCAAEPGALMTTAGFGLTLNAGLEALNGARTVIVPSWRDPSERPPQALLDALIYARDFAARYPQVTVDADVLYVDEGGVLTSAGTAAGIDACLHLLRRQYGAGAANSVARRLVVPPHRQGGQAQFIAQPLPETARDTRLAAVIECVRADLTQAHSLDSLADSVAMSRRSFTRHFRQLTGSTVGAWLLSERLARSQALLEGSDQSVEQVAELAGFGSAVSLRAHFRHAFGVSPTAWRQTFRGGLK